MSTAFIAGIQYKSGRRIYCDERPDCGEFIESPALARRFPSIAPAQEALEALIRFFEIRDRSAIQTFIEPCPSSR